ncbi:recombination protein NinB [Paraburkholderia sacchari]|uniref:recombination protein NinB n=1 Tax=Paraburkholderia sacchari TaxID=159450 RepID=UPI003D9922AE
MNRVFVLRDKECAQRMLDYIKSTAGPMASAGKPLSVEIGEYQQKRSSDQNRLYWSVLAEIAEAAEIEGKRFSREAWHEHFRSEYLPKQESPSGLVAMSTTQLTKQEFADYVTRIQAFATQTLGVEFACA